MSRIENSAHRGPFAREDTESRTLHLIGENVWLDARQAAQYAGEIGVCTIRQACNLNRLRHVRIGGGQRGPIRTRREWVDDWMQSWVRGGEAACASYASLGRAVARRPGAGHCTFRAATFAEQIVLPMQRWPGQIDGPSRLCGTLRPDERFSPPRLAPPSQPLPGVCRRPVRRLLSEARAGMDESWRTWRRPQCGPRGTRRRRSPQS